MALFILLTGEQSCSVRGPSAVTPAAALGPVERQGGVLILNALVLFDASHVAYHDFLAALPQLDSAEPAFPAAIDPPE